MTANPNFLPGRPPKVEFLVREHMVGKAMSNSRRYNIFHPSAWGSCLRKIAYQYYNDQEPFVVKRPIDVDARIERVFDNGHSTHARWQNYLDCAGILRGAWKCTNPMCDVSWGHAERLGVFSPAKGNQNFKCKCGCNKVSYEEPLIKSSTEYNFEGHCDAIIDVRGTQFEQGNPSDVFVVDFKTIKDDLFSELVEAKHEHVIQVNIYMWVLDLQAAVVVYENKDNQALKEMFVPRDDELIEKIKTQSIWLADKLKKKQLPFRPVEFSRSKYPCRFCEFVDHCYR